MAQGIKDATFETIAPNVIAIVAGTRAGSEKVDRVDKWSFCLKAA
ncbi:hypothetical protein [Labrys neptuniae]